VSDQTAAEQPPVAGKQVTGYCEPLTLRAGEPVTLFASSHTDTEATLDLVRISCGDPTRSGPGYLEHEVASDLPAGVVLDHQPLVPGSFATADLSGLRAGVSLQLRFTVRPTLLERDGCLASITADGDDGNEAPIVEVLQRDGRLVIATPAGEDTWAAPLRLLRWYDVAIDVDLSAGSVGWRASTRPTRSPARDLMGVAEGAGTCPAVGGTRHMARLWLAASHSGARFDGRVASPELVVDGRTTSWNLSAAMAAGRIPAAHGDRPLELHQLPTRAVPGPDWDGSHQRWTDHPDHWDAVHFHHDDLYDAGWNATATLALPRELPSGIYAFRLRSPAGEDRVPFFVRPARGAPTADVALLMPSCTYMAYANHRMLVEGADFMGARTRLRPEHEYIRDHPELGRSHYEKHPDGSGVMFSSRRRPVLQLRPGADGWNFTPDTDINAFLDHLEVGHDIVTDEDLHAEGQAAIAPYRVLVTGTHPEYWSTAMLDALESWQRAGGRLMYLGGNGFYWRVAFSDDWPGAIELRRAEDGVRNWQTEHGENYHAWGGEYGGLWRRQGRAPNELVGVGFAAQGFDKATHYVRDPDALESRAAWILDGVDDELIGTSGLGGGAAGQEIDRWDPLLGSPEHAVVLASATTFGPDMLRTKEEFEGSVVFPTPDPLVRADIVFFETSSGGAVFSASSISWFGALARNGYDNDVARITENVLRRFLDPEPFPTPFA
jgi:N,N-dimethylformamidase